MAAHQAPHPWDSPGKNTGVGCHFLLQCMKVKSESEVTQLCPTLRDPMDCSLPGSSIHGIFQARVLEWGAIAFSNNKSNDKQKLKSKKLIQHGVRNGSSSDVLSSQLSTLGSAVWILVLPLSIWWRRQWHPTPILFLPGKSHGRRSLVGCSPGGPEELDTTE